MREPGAVAVRRWLKADAGATSRLSDVEVASALVRRAREGAFSVKERDRALASLADDVATLIVVECTSEITAEARALLLDPPTVMGVESLELDHLNVRVVARTLPGKQFEVARRLRERIAAALHDRGIRA